MILLPKHFNFANRPAGFTDVSVILLSAEEFRLSIMPSSRVKTIIIFILFISLANANLLRFQSWRVKAEEHGVNGIGNENHQATVTNDGAEPGSILRMLLFGSDGPTVGRLVPDIGPKKVSCQ